MLRQKNNGKLGSKYSPSEQAALKVLNDNYIDMEPLAISEETKFAHSTITKALQSLEEKGDVVVTREVQRTKLYRSQSQLNLIGNMSKGPDESGVGKFILDMLEHAPKDIAIPQLVPVSKYTHHQIRRKMHQLEEDGLVEENRLVDHTSMYKSSD